MVLVFCSFEILNMKCTWAENVFCTGGWNGENLVKSWLKRLYSTHGRKR